jgi:triacylglycerol lipase
MPERSALARLQQAAICCVVLVAAAWMLWRWPQSPWGALAGGVGILCIAGIVLAVELGLLAAVPGDPATLRPSLRELVQAWWGETAQFYRIFCWRQPFAWRAVGDHLAPAAPGLPGVVFIHGFACNRGFWTPWMRLLRDRGQPFVAVNLEPVFGEIDSYAPIIEAAVRRLTHATGRAPALICHSMGGVAARAWLRARGDPASVCCVVTIGSPHRGTWLGRFSRRPNGRQMRLGSDWLGTLARDEAQRQLPPLVCWYTNCDNIVFPVTTATLPQADNRLVRGVAHVALGFHPRVVSETLTLISAHETGAVCGPDDQKP